MSGYIVNEGKSINITGSIWKYDNNKYLKQILTHVVYLNTSLKYTLNKLNTSFNSLYMRWITLNVHNYIFHEVSSSFLVRLLNSASLLVVITEPFDGQWYEIFFIVNIEIYVTNIYKMNTNLNPQ